MRLDFSFPQNFGDEKVLQIQIRRGHATKIEKQQKVKQKWDQIQFN